MVYKLTPLNFFAGLVVGVLIVNFIYPDPNWGNSLVIYLLLVVIVSLIVDFIIQKTSKHYLLTFLLELAMIVIFLLLNIGF